MRLNQNFLLDKKISNFKQRKFKKYRDLDLLIRDINHIQE